MKPWGHGVQILADENIPFAQEAFGTLGHVTLISGREAGPETFRDCDLFFSRSVTKIDAANFGDSPVRFIATATIGTDHVDFDFLRRRGIGFASAPGSNANSVAEYVTAALLVLARRGGCELAGKTLGVVGVGNVGSRVVAKAEALGMRVLQNDPPLARQIGESRFLPLDALLEADVLTFHTPLTRDGEDASYHLADAELLQRLKANAVVINTSRGPVVANAPLQRHLAEGRLGAAVLDVWEGEPDLDIELLERAAIATPHIAGYSFNGKVAATEMIYRAACEFLDVEPTWSAAEAMPPPPVPHLTIDAAGRADEDVLHEAVTAVYDIEADDRALRPIAQQPPEARAAFFDQLRRNYPERREFPDTELVLHGASAHLRATLAALGFRLATPDRS
jgi:erythronate-4-phosphate dehydrogenase